MKRPFRKHFFLLTVFFCFQGCLKSYEVVVSKPFQVISTHYSCPEGYKLSKQRVCIGLEEEFKNQNFFAQPSERMSILVPGRYPVLESSVLKSRYADLRILYKEKEMSIELRPYRGSKRTFKQSSWFHFTGNEMLQVFSLEGQALESKDGSGEYDINLNFIVGDDVVGILRTKN